MKRIILILLASIFTLAVNAQDVPQNVTNAFSAKYPGTGVKKWVKGKDDYTARFKKDKSRYSVVFSATGDWQRTERKIHWPWNMPPAVNKSFKTGKYAAWYVENINYVETPEKHNYIMRVNNKPLLSLYEMHVFGETRLLYYNDSGELVGTENI